ncbi:meiosis-specific protein MEI4 isoform X3 [Rhineura floridana]|uniref:meiosis-specific protein MEI4 isoform X3 n=1 Tax=Rhineura floridana TaxID=261503 RepID=UPI002AC8207C|nr:meiosis-specific protein MEI4 isoform X3 [Rhineura floridana]
MEDFESPSVQLRPPTGSLASPYGPFAEIKDKEDVIWYLKTSQLALALAIICSKPPDKSSKEYSEHLAKIVSGQNSKQKLRVEALEAEVIHLRQQLLLNKISSGFCLENRNSTAIGEALPPTHTEDCSGHFEDSGCDTSNDYIADTLETLPTFRHSEHSCNNSASGVSSSALPMLTSCCISTSKSLVFHMHFLQRFLELKKLTEAGGLRTDLKKLRRDFSTISDSFSQLLDGLVASYSLPELPFSHSLTQAVCVITNLLNDAVVSRQILGKCLKKLEDSVTRLVAVVLNSNHLNRIQAKYNIQYENIFFLCRVLEQLLETETEHENAANSGFDEKEKKTFLQNLDQAIFHLSDEFPLFCIYLWRLGTLLNAAQIQTNTKTSRPAS